jgi:hypothetical protein
MAPPTALGKVDIAADPPEKPPTAAGAGMTYLPFPDISPDIFRSEEHTSELQSQRN